MKVKDFINKLSKPGQEIILADINAESALIDDRLIIDTNGNFIKLFYDWEIKEIDLAEIANYKTFKLIISEW